MTGRWHDPGDLAALRIGVVDSGVQPGHPHIDGARLDEGVCIASDGSLDRGQDQVVDRLGHGTAVTAAIQQWAPDARIVPVRVFKAALATSSIALVAAIDWCAEQRLDLINLSLGTTVEAHRAALQTAIGRALEAGAIVVSAADTDGTPCFPGALPGAIGVGLDWNCPREKWRLGRAPDGRPCFLASGAPRPIPGVAEQRNLFGVSFAVANMSGFAAAILAQQPRGPGGAERLARLSASLAALAQIRLSEAG